MRSAATRTASATPWLTLPPAVEEGGAFSYKFFSLEEEKVLTFSKRRGGGGDEIPPDDAKIVGSSYGWLALFDEKSNHVFLSNPISDSHVKLPAVPNPHININSLFEGQEDSVSQVVISGPPPLPLEQEQEENKKKKKEWWRFWFWPNKNKKKEWRAMMTFWPGGRLASVWPGTEWEHLDEASGPYDPYGEPVKKLAMRHDLVHHSGEGSGHFTTIQPCKFTLRWGHFLPDQYRRGHKHCEMYHWYSQHVGVTYVHGFQVRHGMWKEMNVDVDMLDEECIQIPHLVRARRVCDTNPLIVLRFVKRVTGRTVFFLVLRIERGDNYLGQVVDDLNGTVLFVGMNHAIAFPATGKLKPNSIYFTRIRE